MTMMQKRMARLRRDEGGVATVEFALWTTLFFFVAIVAIDFGAFFIERGRMNEAVGAAAVASFSSADNVNFANLPTYVRGITGESSTAVTTSCNGVDNACTNFARTCACLKSDGSYVTAACGNICTGEGVTGGSTAGYYLTIKATRPYQAMMVPDSAIDNALISQAATVRLQ